MAVVFFRCASVTRTASGLAQRDRKQGGMDGNPMSVEKITLCSPMEAFTFLFVGWSPH